MVTNILLTKSQIMITNTAVTQLRFYFVKIKKEKNRRNVTNEQIVGHVPEPLAEILYQIMKEQCILSTKVIIITQERNDMCLKALGFLGVALNYPVYTTYMQQRLIKNTSVKNQKTKKKEHFNGDIKVTVLLFSYPRKRSI